MPTPVAVRYNTAPQRETRDAIVTIRAASFVTPFVALDGALASSVLSFVTIDTKYATAARPVNAMVPIGGRWELTFAPNRSILPIVYRWERAHGENPPARAILAKRSASRRRARGRDGAPSGAHAGDAGSAWTAGGRGGPTQPPRDGQRHARARGRAPGVDRWAAGTGLARCEIRRPRTPPRAHVRAARH